MSTYNKKLPQPTDICLMNASRANRSDAREMPFGGVTPTGVCYLGWRQSSFAYSYQVQYMAIARLVPDKQLSTGSTTSKTGWKYPNSAWGTVDVNKLNKGAAADKKNRWYRYLGFGGKSFMTKGSYDKLTLRVRVRSYNTKAKQHGPWVTKDIVFKCRPTVKVHKLVALADGGLRVYLNTGGWKRSGSSLVMKDVRHAGEGANQAKKEFSVEVDSIGGEEAADYPYVDIAGSRFNADFRPNESVAFAGCAFRTCDGVDAPIDGTYAIDPQEAAIDEPVVSIARDEGTGTITATFGKSDAGDDWDKTEAWLTCDVQGEAVRFDRVRVVGADDSARTCTFRPPLDCAMRLHIGVTNDLGGACYLDLTEEDREELRPIPSNGRIMLNYTDGTDPQPTNGMFNGSKCAVLEYDAEHSSDAARAADTFEPFGRGRPVAVLGDCVTRNVKLKGSVDATEERAFQNAAHSHLSDWEAFQEQQGIVLLRMPHGRWMHALCTGVDIEQEDEFGDTCSVGVSLVEVDV